MAEHERQLGVRKLAVDNVQISGDTPQASTRRRSCWGDGSGIGNSAA